MKNHNNTGRNVVNQNRGKANKYANKLNQTKPNKQTNTQANKQNNTWIEEEKGF